MRILSADFFNLYKPSMFFFVYISFHVEQQTSKQGSLTSSYKQNIHGYEKTQLWIIFLRIFVRI